MTREILVALFSILMALWISRVLKNWRGSWRARRRAVRAGRGEDVAADMLEDAGYTVMEVDTSEFRKLDGGVSCLSLRY